MSESSEHNDFYTFQRLKYYVEVGYDAGACTLVARF